MLTQLQEEANARAELLKKFQLPGIKKGLAASSFIN
jgi:hypothetical protein